MQDRIMTDENQSEATIDLGEIFRTLVHKIWLIVLIAVVGGALAFCLGLFAVTPQYESTVKLYVNNASETMNNTKSYISTTDIDAAQSLVNTYIVILNSRSTLEKVIDRADLDMTHEQLGRMIHAGSVNGTEVLSITVRSPKPEEAEHIANTIAEVLPEAISEIVEGSSVKLVENGVIPGKKASPDLTRYTLIGMLLGGLICCALIVSSVITDTKIKSAAYLIENYPEIPLLCTVPDITKSSGKKYGRYGY